MKIVRFSFGSKIQYGVLKKDIILGICGSPFENFNITGDEFMLGEVELLAPVQPSKIIAVGLNYVDHAHELRMDIPDEPIIFIKSPTALIGPNEKIIYPVMSRQVDYEAELGIVIKDKIKDVSLEKAKEHVLGFTCVNDVTARDLQKKDVQWTRAKSFDTFCPIGPCVETEIDPKNLSIELLLNEEVKQSSNTSNMIFGVYFLVGFISRVMTLFPGDVILTGTPPGVGPMQVGDVVEVRIEGIGTLRNKVAASKR